MCLLWIYYYLLSRRCYWSEEEMCHLFYFEYSGVLCRAGFMLLLSCCCCHFRQCLKWVRFQRLCEQGWSVTSQ